MASIQFKEYFVSKMDYLENENYDDNVSELDVSSSFETDVFFKNELVLVMLSIKLGDADNTDCPFIVNIDINGLFEYSLDKSNEKDVAEFKNLITQNAVAIIYPYARSLVADLTLRSNRFPAYLLPTINVVQIMQENDAIRIHDVNLDEK